MADSTTATANSDSHNYPGFKRYWDHYNAMKLWMTSYAKAWENHLPSNLPYQVLPENVRAPRRVSSTSNSERSSPYSSNLRRSALSNSRGQRLPNGRASRTPMAKRIVQHSNAISECESSTGFDNGENDDDEECLIFEITDELKTFFQKSQKHKEEREKEKERLAMLEDEGSIKKDDQFKAPSERPGSKRNNEMKILYGKFAPAIQGLETAIQMEFDHNLDKKQPQLWPSIALNL